MSYEGDDFADIPEDSRIQEVAREEVFKQAIRFQERWQDLLREAGWVNTGETLNDITLEPQRQGSDSYRVGGDRTALLISEFGRRPGAKAPPPDKLGQWVHEQQGLPNKGDDEFDTTVYLIGQSIAENGIEPVQAGRRAFQNVEGVYEQNVERRLSESE